MVHANGLGGVHQSGIRYLQESRGALPVRCFCEVSLLCNLRVFNLNYKAFWRVRMSRYKKDNGGISDVMTATRGVHAHRVTSLVYAPVGFGLLRCAERKLPKNKGRK